ncbi:PIN domain-containing protein [Candidatus Acetothermia bacterium]|jgi:predicted nucleic acid-binding protein|nr:PIN domain-containing protein [Candidatus Acetothermia bacterium]MCI2431814.1 PIN domain-containing protein [Candidatus Acetothermia bacterium]MCI2435740.1 PIN domain-containing protein [Candidatus Acetothermia bacterium]
MNQRVFIDTSAFYALAARRDDHHDTAKKAYERLLSEGTLFVLTDHVLAESATLIRRKLGYQAAQDFLRLIEEGKAVQLFQVIDIDDILIEVAKEIFRKDADPKLSFVDALSLAVMQTQRIRRFFAFDQHFQKTGSQDVIL